MEDLNKRECRIFFSEVKKLIENSNREDVKELLDCSRRIHLAVNERLDYPNLFIPEWQVRGR